MILRLALLILLPGTLVGSQEPQVSLLVQTRQGISLKSVALGSPFKVIVSVSPSGAVRELPDIQGLSELHVVGQGTRRFQDSSTGKDELQIQYTVVADKEGDLTLGPATFAQFPQVTSEAHTISVVKAVEQDAAEYQKPDYEFKVSAKDAYSGQKIHFTARFTWQDPQLKLSNVQLPDVAGIRIENVSEGQAATEVRDGSMLKSILIEGDMFVYKPGKVIIPRLRADYSLPGDDRRWSSFFSFATREKHSAYSDPVRIEIQPLPQTDKDIAAVGKFSGYTGVLNKNEAPQGEAVLLTLSLKGETDFSRLKAPKLILPDSFKYYESKIMRLPDGITWEYILQGLEEGSYTIEKQEFEYFNTETKKYASLSTEPLEVAITPGVASVVLPKREELPTIPQEKSAITAGVPHVPLIPFSLFVLLMLIPPLFVLGRFLLTILSPSLKKLYSRWRSSRALKRARKKIKQLEAAGDAEHLHVVLKESLIDYYGVDEQHLADLLKEKGVDWPELLREMLQYSEYAQEQKVPKKELFQKAYRLLGTLAKVLVIISFHGSLLASVSTVAQTLSVIPFIVWQLGLLIGWWAIWLLFDYLSSEMRYVVGFLWLCMVAGWALRAPYEYRPRLRVAIATTLHIGPSEDYPVKTSLDRHDELHLVKKLGKWYYVSLPSKNSGANKGWVLAEHSERVA